MALCEEQVPGIARRKSRPEEGSIHATIVANRSTRLYVHPLQWTGQHLELLSSILHPPPSSPGCESGNTAVQMQEDLVLHGLIWGRCLYAAANINRWRDLRIREKKLRMVVTYLCKAATGLQVQSDFLRFRYASRTAAYLNVPFHFCLNNQRPDQRCAWAYLERSWCWDQRYNFYSYRKKRPYRYAMQACRDADRYPFDPFCLAVLISLAQTARRAAGGVEPLKVSLFIPQHQQDPGSRLVTTLIQYTALIPHEYLQKFDDPCRFSDSTLHIHQVSWGLNQLPGILEAVRDASGFPHQQEAVPSSSIVTKKRKALEDITDASNQPPCVLRQKME